MDIEKEEEKLRELIGYYDAAVNSEREALATDVAEQALRIENFNRQRREIARLKTEVFNYRMAFKVLSSMVHELRKNNITTPALIEALISSEKIAIGKET